MSVAALRAPAGARAPSSSVRAASQPKPKAGRGKTVRVSAFFGVFGAKPQASKAVAEVANIGKAAVLAKADITAPGEVGFRYDAANNRWVRDDKFAGKIDEDKMVAMPMSGANYTVWPVMHTFLVAKGLKSVTPEQALELQGKGWTLVDVRVFDDYDKEHAAGAINLPLYRPVQGTGMWDNIKRGVMAVGFAMRATERDPDYRAKVAAALPVGSKAILLCSIGGTLDTLLDLRPGVKKAIPDPDRAFGRESRALKAAYELMQMGWSSSNLLFVEGGLHQWRHNGLPTEATGEEEQV